MHLIENTHSVSTKLTGKLFSNTHLFNVCTLLVQTYISTKKTVVQYLLRLKT